MSGTEFDPDSDTHFKESEHQPTQMTYDKGGIPFYIAIAWVVFLIAYVVYMVVYGLPDLAAWRALSPP